jgi:hypothetical protein
MTVHSFIILPSYIGVCDCCDGSDEGVKVVCEDTCVKDAGVYKKEMAVENKVSVSWLTR